MPFLPGSHPDQVHPVPPPPKPSAPRRRSASPSSYSTPRPTSNPDIVSHMGRPPVVYRPRIVSMPSPYHYEPPRSVLTRTQRQNRTQQRMQEQIQYLQQNGGSDYEVSLALDAAIRQRYNFITNTDRRQANRATHRLLSRFNQAQEEMYNPPDAATQLLRRKQGKDPITLAPKLHLKKREAFDPTLPGAVGTLKQFNELTRGMGGKQLSYMGTTLKNMLYASEQDRGAIHFNTQRLRDARKNFQLTKQKNDAFIADHPEMYGGGVTSGETNESSLYGHQVDDGPNLGGIGHFFSSAADKAGGAIGAASHAAGDVIGEAHDLAEKIDPTINAREQFMGDVWNSDFVQSTRHIAGEATGTGLSWTLDKLSRPLYAVAGGWDKIGALGEGESFMPTPDGPLGLVFTAGGVLGGGPLAPFFLTGVDPVASAKGAIKHPGRVLNVPKEMGSQFANGGFGNAKDPTTFSRVIANQAERNPQRNIYDSHAYQVGGGLVGDVAGDPLNLIGVGAGTKLVTVTKALGGAKETTSTARDISKILKDTDVHEITPEHVEELLTGGMRKHLPKSVKDRVAATRYMNEGHAWLHEALTEAGRRSIGTADREAKLAELGSKMRKAEITRNNLVKSFQLDTQARTLTSQISRAVKDGKLPAGSEQKIQDMVTTTHIQNKLVDMLRLRSSWRNANEVGKTIRQELGLDEGASWDDVIAQATDSPAYKGRVREFEGHKAVHEGDRAYDLLPDAIKNSGLFTAKTFDDLLGNAYGILKSDHAGDVGTKFKRFEEQENKLREAIRRTDDEYEREGLKTTLRHTQGKKLRTQAAVILQMIKDQAARKAGQTVYTDPEYASNMQKIIDEVDNRLGRQAVGGGTADIPAERQAFLEAEGPKARNFTDIEKFINERGEFHPDLFAGDSGFYNGEQQLDRIRQFAERGLQRSNTVSNQGKVRSFSELKDQELNIDLPEHLADRDILEHHLQLDKGEVRINDASSLTPEDRQILEHLKDAITTERENIFSAEQASARARKSDDLTRRVTEAVESERKNAQDAALKGFKDRAIPSAGGFALFVEHNGSKIKQGTTETSKLVEADDTKRAETLKNILDNARYPSDIKGALDDKDIAKLQWLFKQNGYIVPKSVKTADDWYKLLKGDARFFDNQSRHQSDDFRAFNETMFKTTGRKASDTVYLIVKPWVEPGNIAFNRVYKAAHSELPFDTRLKIEKKLPKFDVKGRTAELRQQLRESNRPLGDTKHYDAMRQNAAERARKMVLGKTLHSGLSADKFDVKLHPSELPDYQELKAAMDEKHAQEMRDLKRDVENDPQVRAKAQAKKRYLNSRIKKLRQQHDVERAALEQARKDALEAHQVYQKRLLEEARLRVIQSQMVKQHGLKLHFVGGSETFLPTPAVLAKSADVLGGLPLIRHTREIYAKAFRPPTAGMEQDLVRARNHRFGMTANIIESHVKELESTFGPMTKEQRIRGMSEWLAGSTDDTATKIGKFFDDLVPYYSRQHPVGDDVLTIDKINAQLPDVYRAHSLDDLQDGKDIIRAVEQGANARLNHMSKHLAKLKDGPEKIALKQRHDALVRRLKKDALSDPYDVLWHLRIGIENAQGLMAFEHTIKDSFGIRRIGEMKDGRFVHNNSELAKATERLGNKDTGWETIPALGNGHYFPSEIVKDVTRLIDSMQPQNINKLSELFDQATRAWKGIATIYNPGYWTRNGLGEILATHMAGHSNPKDYIRSARLIRYMNRDGKDLEALKSQFPMDQHLVGDDSVKGSTVAFHMRNGEPVTYEMLNLAMHGEGMKTGFFNTEFERNKLVDSMMSTPGLKNAVRGHRKLRDAGEDYETFLRAAHFLAATRKSSKPFDQAVADAALEVRKYHFDYTEFTPFEKQVMLRAFPFYKWTRRAIPLFFGMLFTKPGKMMVYPKTMNAASDLLTTDDIKDDHNGFLPNYNTPGYSGIVPTWMQDMMAYQIGGEQDDATGMFLNINVPQYDALKSGFQPQQTGLAMLNPLIKAPIEQVRGKTLGDTVGSFSYDLNDKDEGNINRINELLGTVPGARFAGRVGLDQNKLDLGQLISFMTGAGSYENTPARQFGELQSRQGKQ